AASSHDRTPSRGTNRTGTSAGNGDGWDRKWGRGAAARKRPSLTGGRSGGASTPGKVGRLTGGAGQPAGSPGATARAAPTTGSRMAGSWLGWRASSVPQTAQQATVSGLVQPSPWS